MLKRFKRVYVYHREDGGVGLLTTPTSKPYYVERARDYLYDDGMNFDPEFISSNPYLDRSIDKTKYTKEDFKKELLKFKIYSDPPTKVGGRPKISYSGKADDEGRIVAGQEDDKVMAWLINCGCNRSILRGHSTVPIRRLMAATAA